MNTSVSSERTIMDASSGKRAERYKQCRIIAVSSSSCVACSSGISFEQVCCPSELVRQKQAWSQTKITFLPKSAAYLSFCHSLSKTCMRRVLLSSLDKKAFQSLGTFVSAPLTKYAFEEPFHSLSMPLIDMGW